MRILSIEDDPKDARHSGSAETEGVACEVTRVDTRLRWWLPFGQGGIDLIWRITPFPRRRHFRIKFAMKACPEVPFIFVSGTLGEK